MFSQASPLFVSVTVWGLLFVPTSCGLNMREVGDRVTTGRARPDNFTMNASGRPAAHEAQFACNPLAVGKSEDWVSPTTYALPPTSIATEVPWSLLLPPR